jgi:hypothetical protein
MKINKKTKASLILILTSSIVLTFFSNARSDPGLGEFRWLGDTNLALCGQPEDNSQWDTLISWGISSCINMLSGTSKDDVPYLLSQGLTYLHLPTIDWDISPGETHAGVQWINKQLADGRKVLIHCYHGTSRTPTMAAMWYIHQGHTAEEAIAWVKSYPPSYPSEMATQAIYDYYDWLKMPEPEPITEPEPEPITEPEPEPITEPEPEPTPALALNTSISMSVDVSSTVMDSVINVKGIIVDANGSVLENSYVNLSHSVEGSNWIHIGSGITNAAGEYNIQWANATSGIFKLKVEWDGNDNYLGANNTRNLGVLSHQDNKSVCVESNSTISPLTFNMKNAKLSVEVGGPKGTTGYIRATIPKDILVAEDNWIILVNDNPITPTVDEDARNTYIYFTYGHSIENIDIIGSYAIPEFSSWTIIPLVLIVTFVLLLFKRRLSKRKLGNACASYFESSLGARQL